MSKFCNLLIYFILFLVFISACSVAPEVKTETNAEKPSIKVDKQNNSIKKMSRLHPEAKLLAVCSSYLF